MGCDIHLFVETRRNGKWQREEIVPEQYRDPFYVKMAAEHGGRYEPKAEREWYHDRNYEAFAVLADVRNDGFIVPIDQPRGWPDDLSEDGLKLVDEEREYDEGDVYMGEHSASWLTLAELQAYPWGGRATQSGVVSLQEFMERVVKHGDRLPVKVDRYPYKSWSQDIMGNNIVIRDASEILIAIKAGGFNPLLAERTHVRDQWSTPVSSQMHGLTERLIPALTSLGLPPDDVRIVFNFDS